MTKAVLTERLRAYDRLWMRIALGMFPVLVLLPFAAMAVLSLVVGPRPGPPEGSEKWQALSLPLAVSGVAMLLLALTMWAGGWTARRHGLLCPSCGDPLTGRHRRAVLGAGRCGRCRTAIVEEAPALPAGVTLPARDDLLTRLAGYEAAYRRQGIWYVNGLLPCFLPGALAAWPFQVFVEPALRSAGLFPLALLMFVVITVSPFFVYVYFLLRWEGRLRRSYGLTCPWCGAGLTGANGRRAAASGRCGACGQPVWAEVV
jgi:hypothetical protein